MAPDCRPTAVPGSHWGISDSDAPPTGPKRIAAELAMSADWWPAPWFFQKHKRHIDIELTNVCNTQCVFCPREKTPKQGFIGLSTFEAALGRARELGTGSDVGSCGQGEPMLHPNLVRFVSLAAEKGFSYSMSTNGSLLTKERSRQLVDAGLKTLFVSASGIGRVYETIHRLEFASVSRNVRDFVHISNGRCGVVIGITLCDLNVDRIEEAVEYWRNAGIHGFLFSHLSQRCSAVDAGYLFRTTEECRAEAVGIAMKNRIRNICVVPFRWYSVGWDGNYYVCSHEYRKMRAIGNVHFQSVADIQERNIRGQLRGLDVCQACEFLPVNRIHEMMLRVRTREATEADLRRVIWRLRTAQKEAQSLLRTRP